MRFLLKKPVSKEYPLFNPQHTVSLDVETCGVAVWGKRLLKGVLVQDAVFSVTMCDEKGNSFYCEWEVNPHTRIPQINQRDVKFIRDTIKGKRVVFHNSKFDVIMLLPTVGIDVVALAKSIEDTLFMARVCFTLELTYGLKPLARRLGVDDSDEKELADIVKQARTMAGRYNTLAAKEGMPLIVLGENYKEDYWLPAYMAKHHGVEHWEGINKNYCIRDGFRTMLLYRHYERVMFDEMEQGGYLRRAYELEMRQVWPIVNRMEKRGLRIFPELAREESNKCIEAMAEHKAAMEQIIDELKLNPFPEGPPEPKLTPTGRVSRTKVKAQEFSPGSTKQLIAIMYGPEGEGGPGTLNIEPHYPRKGKYKGTPQSIEDGTARLTTEKDALKELMYIPFVKELVGYRSASHTKSLFFDPILGDEKEIIKRTPWEYGKGDIKHDTYKGGDWVVHFSLNQCGTKTSRFSAGGEMGFNPQQATAGGKKSLGGGKYSSQKVFGPREGYVWLAFDFSQQEGRIFAELAGITLMLDALKYDRDIFEEMAQKAWGGRDNPDSIRAGIIALELFRDSPSNCDKCNGDGEDKLGYICEHCGGSGSAVGNYWKKIEWSARKAAKYRPDNPTIYSIVQEWLAENNYNIIQAEHTLGKEASRQRCKHITYAKIFGGGPGSYAHLLMCTLDEAKQFDADYNASMPEMKVYMRELTKKAEKDGFIITLYDRKLRVDRNFAYRGVSYMIQGSAAGMMKDSLIKVDDFLERSNTDAQVLLTIHDALYVEAPKKLVTAPFIASIVDRMESNDGRLNVKMPVGVDVIDHQWSVAERHFKLTDSGLLIPKE